MHGMELYIRKIRYCILLCVSVEEGVSYLALMSLITVKSILQAVNICIN